LDNPESTDRHRALHLPRLYEAERNALVPPGTTNVEARGLMIFNRDTRCLEFWSSNEWISLCVGDAVSREPMGTWVLRVRRYTFDPDTIPQCMLDCLIAKYGSVDAYKESMTTTYVETNTFLFHFVETRYWIGQLIDGVAYWNYENFACWRWADETKTTWYHHWLNSGEESCPSDFTSSGNYFDFQGNNRLIVIERNQRAFSAECTDDCDELGEIFHGRMAGVYEFERLSDDLFNPSAESASPASVPLRMPRNFPSSGIFSGFR
jgi:hypothetical protein